MIDKKESREKNFQTGKRIGLMIEEIKQNVNYT